MTSYPTTSPFQTFDSSTKTKETPFYMPGVHLTEEDQAEEDRLFSKFIEGTAEAQRFVHASQMDDAKTEAVTDYYKEQENFLRKSAGATGGKVEDLIGSWQSDRTDTPLLSITVAGDGLQLFQPRKLAQGDWQMADEFTFRGGSVFGALLDKEAVSPMFTELVGRNAQANHFAAVRARGGKQGELWTTSIANSAYLRDMLIDSTTTRDALQEWIDTSPSAISVKGSIPGSSYAADTMLDTLADAPIPEGWDPKEAIEALKVADPGLTKVLFEDMGVEEARLIELSKNPLQFKYFIADAIDTFAYQSYLREYTAAAGFWEESYSTMLWPLLRDSLNSNDQFAELMLTAVAVGLTATGAGAIVGVPLLAATVGRKTLKVYKIVDKIADSTRIISRAGAQAARINQFVWKTQKFIPSRITDTALDSWSVSKRFFEIPKDAGRLNRIARMGAKQFVGEAGQGVLESIVQQGEAMENGFQENFSMGHVFDNALQEGIGGTLLGIPMKSISKGSEKIMTTKLGDRINELVDASKEAIARTKIITPDVKNAVDLAVRMTMGIPDGVNVDDWAGAVEQRLHLNNALRRINHVTGITGLLDGGDNEDPLVKAAVHALSGGDPRANFGARVELLKRMTTFLDLTMVNGKETATAEDMDTLLFLAAEDAAKTHGDAVLARVTEASFVSHQKRKGITTNAAGKPLTLADATEADMKEVAEKRAESVTLLAAKLGAKDASEIAQIFGASLSPSDIAAINLAVNEDEEAAAANGETERVGVDLGGIPGKGIIKTVIDPAAKRAAKVTPEATPTVAPEAPSVPSKAVPTPEATSAAPSTEEALGELSEAVDEGSPETPPSPRDSVDIPTSPTEDLDKAAVAKDTVTEVTPTETTVVKAPEPTGQPTSTSNVQSLIAKLLSEDASTTDEANVELTEEEMNDLNSRSCTRKDT